MTNGTRRSIPTGNKDRPRKAQRPSAPLLRRTVRQLRGLILADVTINDPANIPGVWPVYLLLHSRPRTEPRASLRTLYIPIIAPRNRNQRRSIFHNAEPCGPRIRQVSAFTSRPGSSGDAGTFPSVALRLSDRGEQGSTRERVKYETFLYVHSAIE